MGQNQPQPVSPAIDGSLPPAADGSLPPAADGSLPPAADGSLPPAADGSLPPAADGSLSPAVDGVAKQSGSTETQLDAFGGFEAFEPGSPGENGSGENGLEEIEATAGIATGESAPDTCQDDTRPTYTHSDTAHELAPCEHEIDHIELQSIWVSMPNNEQFHLRRFTPVFADTNAIAELQQLASRHEAAPRRMFMLHGEAESGKVFYNESGQGLAWYFARQGYEVFVADLAHRGRSLASDTEQSTLTVSELVRFAIPRLLRAIEQCPHRDEDQYFHRSDIEREAQVWVGHGFGAVLLSAAWARLEDHERKATEMIFFGGRRRHKPNGKLASLFHTLVCHPLSAWLVHWRNYFPARRLLLGDVDESAEWFRVYTRWMRDEQWLDTEDDFDYGAALRQCPIPAGLHFAATGDTVFAQPTDVRLFVEELGPHDARTVILDHSEGRAQKYNHLGMLHHPQAEEDVFAIANAWLISRLAAAQGYAAYADAAQKPSLGQQPELNPGRQFAEQKELNLCA